MAGTALWSLPNTDGSGCSRQTMSCTPPLLSWQDLQHTFKEVGCAPLSHFVSCIHIGHKLGEGAGDGARPDP